ncbi:MAG: Eco57I restriction-modification methylase domain-containing protein [Planctomycetota bacterium]|jgi:hypothetical protein|nr:Eco57I restriction-modification methylase domain-containing protein [Planctomycetota bacterium]
MTIDIAAVRNCLKAFDFATLFREHLGWDHLRAGREVAADGETFNLSAIAQKRGFIAYSCPSIPGRSTRLKIDRQIVKAAREHFIIYADRAAGRQVWQWVRREPGKPLASREHGFDVSGSGDPLIQRLGQIAVSLDEEEDLTLPVVAGRARAAFDVDRVTKRFFDRFKLEHAAFLKLVKGVDADADRQWYASLMLNRLMFVYFIQKKGFLDGDPDYLRNRLALVRQAKGGDKFQSFYRHFLLRLFHDGLGKAPGERKLDAGVGKLLGEIPYLDGGFFEVHRIESNHPELDIPDRAFEKLFDFFDQYSWHLDDRPLRADNEINPDVVGYIFEKYINQKQMGAYYTREDITEYIAKNSIIPFLFDAAERKCAIAFQPESALWRLLRDDPDRYIYPSVRQGVLDDQGHVLPLPGDIEAGIKDAAKRSGWNRPAGEPFGLPTETWREHVARRRRCLDIREKLRKGEVHRINDLITLNLDGWQLARDAIVNAEGPDLLRAFWHAVGKVAVLDPTCGSGAFLFAALRILETLYGDCLERMERFVEEPAGGRRRPGQYGDFRKVLAQIAGHPGARHFILKSIIINNLFGVDIMEEATEICKLRLFLKLVAQVEKVEQIEPLPDIDFNIRAGNALVGYATEDQVRKAFTHEMNGQGKLMLGDSADAFRRFEESVRMVATAFRQFRAQQTVYGGRVTHEDKQELRARLAELDGELDRYLAGEYGVKIEKRKDFAAWKASHKPFHWFVEFYEIMRGGGFDVVIGNPPYVNAAKVRKSYTLIGYIISKCPDVYANVQERCLRLLSNNGRCGMIVPLSLGFSGDFQILRDLLYSEYANNWFSSYGRIPAALFSADVRVRNTIHLGAKASVGDASRNFTTVLHRWFEAFRGDLIPTLSYAQFDPAAFNGLIPKINTQALSDAFSALSRSSRKRFELSLSTRPTTYPVHFKKSAYNWLNFCKTLPPCYDAEGKRIAHTKFGQVWFGDSESRDIALLLLNGKIMFAFWCMIGDDFDVTKWMFSDFPAALPTPTAAVLPRLLTLGKRLDECMRKNVSFKVNAGKRVGNYNLAMCRLITDESDAILAKMLGLYDVMDDIELMYSQVVKTDFSSSRNGEDDV